MALIQTVTWCELLVRTSRAGGQTKVVSTTKREFEGDEFGTKTERHIFKKFRRLRQNKETPNFGYIGKGLTN